MSWSDTEWDAGSVALLQSGAIEPRVLIWISARNRSTNAEEAIGFWNGEDSQTFTNGTSRDFYGAQGSAEMDDLVSGRGLEIRSQRIVMSGITPEAEELVRTKTVRLAKIEFHQMLLSPTSGLPIQIVRKFKGIVIAAPIQTAEVNGRSTLEIQVESQMRHLARTSALKKSDKSQRRRTNDPFRQYGSVADIVEVEWIRE